MDPEITGDGDVVDGTVLTVMWYLPEESDADGETSAEGDRWNNGDAIGGFGNGGSDTPDEECFMDVVLEMGAATLAAGGAVALAAALAW